MFTGKGCASGAFAIVFQYTAEMYPTEIRSTALGCCSMVGRIGSITAPQVEFNPNIITPLLIRVNIHLMSIFYPFFVLLTLFLDRYISTRGDF